MGIDKQSITLLLFVVVFVLTAAVIATGIIPAIFKTAEKTEVIDTQLNESNYENHQRDLQRYLIVNETNASLKDLEERMQKFIVESENRSSRGAAERQLIIEEMQGVVNKLDTNTVQNSKILASLENKSKDHELQSNQMKTLANSINSSLEAYGENSIEQFLAILENQERIGELLRDEILNLTKTDNEGAKEHRTASNLHHGKLLELMKKMDENIIQNITDIQDNTTN